MSAAAELKHISLSSYILPSSLIQTQLDFAENEMISCYALIYYTSNHYEQKDTNFSTLVIEALKK